jgi:nucleoside-diphosphate-sugar epimerase
MRIFLTGATGYIGSAVLDAMFRGGHDVTTLVRDPRRGEQLTQRGTQVIVGELSKPGSFSSAAESCDVLVHTAYERSKRGQEVDRQAIDALVAAARARSAAGRSTSIVYTSAIWVLGPTQGQATEEWPLRPTPLAAWRVEHEQAVLGAADGGSIRTIIVRPGIVYGGARGIVCDLLRDAQNGLVRVVGDGKNHWPCVYDRDLADLYVRLASSQDAAGVFHANDEADERVEDMVEAIARHSKTRPDVRHMPLAEARAKMGAYADALALDQIVRSPRARALGWTPSLRSVSGNAARLLEEFRASREAA